MWNIVGVNIKNLNTHEDTTVTFPTSGAVMVSGINVDKDNRSNGSGKSSVAEGIAVAFTGESFRHKKAGSGVKDLIRNGEKSLTSTVILVNSVSKDVCEISRTIFANKKSSVLSIKINGETPNQLPTSSSSDGVDLDAGDKFILESILQISKSDLFNYYLLSKDTFKSFLTSTDTEKKSVINRFSNVETIEPVFAKIKAEIESYKKEIILKEKEVYGLESKIESETENLLEYREKLKVDVKSEVLKKLSEKIDTAKKNIANYNDLIKEEKAKAEEIGEASFFDELIKSCEETVSGSSTEILSIQEKLDKEQKRNNSIKRAINELNQIKAENIANINGAVSCPKCKHQFSLVDNTFNIEEAKSIVLEIEKDAKMLNEKFATCKTKQAQIVSELEQKNSFIIQKKNEIEPLKRKVKEIKQIFSNIETIQQKIESNNEMLTMYVSEYEEEEKTSYAKKDESNVYLNKIEKHREQIKTFQAEIVSVEAKISKLYEQESIFKRFKNYLSNQSLSIIEGNTNKFLQLCNSDLEIELDGYKELKSGEIREQINVVIRRNGEVEGAITKFSGGEKATITCCNILALQNVINSTCSLGGLNFAFFDEINDSVDATGITELYSSLNTLSNVILLVSHVRDSGFDNHIFIKKQNNVSQIISSNEYFNLIKS